jgi:integrase/recombinase XerD
VFAYHIVLKKELILVQFYGKMRHSYEKQNTTITIKKGFENYYNFCMAKNLSEKSIAHYASCLDIFGGFYDISKPCSSVTENTIYEYITYLRTTRTIRDTTLNTYLCGIRAMFYYFMKQGYMQPFQFPFVKAVKKIKETYTDHELAILLKKPDINSVTFAEYRNWVLVNYFIGTGNRVSTVCNVKIGDIDFGSGVIHLSKTKNRKEQIIPLSSSLAKVLQEYLTYRKGGAEDYLFCGVSSQKMSETSIRLAIIRYNRHQRGVAKTSVHLFRHTFAKKWILNGGDVFRLQKILGHSSMEIVREYVNMFSDDLKRNFDDFSPLEEFHRASGTARGKSKFTNDRFRKLG